MITSRALHIIAVLVSTLASESLAAEKDYYERFISLIDTNLDRSSLTGEVVRLGTLRQKDSIAGVKLGMTMSEVVRICGKPRSLFSNCGGGPVLGYDVAGFGFKGDKLERITLYSSNSGAVAPAMREEWDYYSRLASLLDTKNVGGFLTNGVLSLDAMRNNGELAGMRLENTMSEAVRVWGRPHSFYHDSAGGIVLAYRFGSIEFAGKKKYRELA